jgi:ABC-type multidrug transport system ATPase subunit
MSGVAVRGLNVGRDDEPRQLRDISLTAHPGELVAIIGASGTGKSTLLSALAGLLPVASAVGTVADVPFGAAEARRTGGVGYVPQIDALHGELTVGSELDYAAQLRGLTDPVSRRQQVHGLLSTLGIGDVLERRIRDLSGGERRRVSVAAELIGRPAVLLLDEATTGLDAAHERDMVAYLRRLADQGCCVVLTTHSVVHLDVFDRLIVLGRHGRVLASGSPQEVLEAVGTDSYVDVFDFSEPFGVVPSEADEAALSGAGRPEADRPESTGPGSEAGKAPALPQGRFRHSTILIHRELDRILANRRVLAFVLVQAPVLGLMVRAMAGPDQLDLGVLSVNLYGRRMLLTLVLCAVWLGSTNSVRSIIGDRAIIRRERAAGVGAGQVLIAKVTALWVTSGVQIIVLCVVALAGMRFSTSSPVIHQPVLASIVMLWICAGAAGSLGLALSSFVRSTDQALAILPILLVPQLVLSGGVIALRDVPALAPISYASTARWGMSGLASTWHLRELESATKVAVPLDTESQSLQRHEDADSGWDPDATAWSLDLLALVGLAAAGTALAGIGLRRT